MEEKKETKRRIFPAGIVRNGELDPFTTAALNMRFRMFMTRLTEQLGLDLETVVSKADQILLEAELKDRED